VTVSLSVGFEPISMIERRNIEKRSWGDGGMPVISTMRWKGSPARPEKLASSVPSSNVM
jgi:hypothetical protein